MLHNFFVVVFRGLNPRRHAGLYFCFRTILIRGRTIRIVVINNGLCLCGEKNQKQKQNDTNSTRTEIVFHDTRTLGSPAAGVIYSRKSTACIAHAMTNRCSSDTTTISADRARVRYTYTYSILYCRTRISRGEFNHDELHSAAVGLRSSSRQVSVYGEYTP